MEDEFIAELKQLENEKLRRKINHMVHTLARKAGKSYQETWREVYRHLDISIPPEVNKLAWLMDQGHLSEVYEVVAKINWRLLK